MFSFVVLNSAILHHGLSLEIFSYSLFIPRSLFYLVRFFLLLK